MRTLAQRFTHTLFFLAINLGFFIIEEERSWLEMKMMSVTYYSLGINVSNHKMIGPISYVLSAFLNRKKKENKQSI